MKSIKKNLKYQTVLQILNTILPLITSPYLSRVLLAEGLGIFSYTQSIINYFTLIAMLGVINYGTRTIASCGENKKERSIIFWNIYALQVFVSMISLSTYIIYVSLFLKENVVIAWFQIFWIIAAMFDISWVFFGVEDFTTTVKINMFIKVISVLAILIFVKSIDDLWIYTLIMSGSTFLASILLWKFLFKIINITEIKNIKIKEICKHIKPNLILFIPLLAMSIYHIMDKTMLGILSSYKQIGYYYNADKIINIPIGIITGIGTVMLPRITSIVNSGYKKEADEIFKFSIEMIAIISIAMTFGIAAISSKFVPFFFGKGFEQCILLIRVLSPVLIIKGLSYTAKMQYLIPNFKEKIFIESVFLGAVVNLITNIILIPKLAAMGAVLGTLIAEFVSCFWQYIYILKNIKLNDLIFKFCVYILFGFIMFITIYIIGNLINSNVISIVIEVLLGMISYGGLCIIYWFLRKDPIINYIRPNKSKGVK